MPQLAIIFSIAILVLALYYMNVKGIEYIEDNSTPMGSFMNATSWLSKNLGPNDIVLVPHPAIFYTLDPQIKDQIKDYKTIWDGANVIWQANTTEGEVARVKYYLEGIIRHESSLKYVVIDWFYPYAKRIFKTQSCSDLGDLLHEVKRFDFQTPNVLWKNKLIVCEKTDV